MPMLNTITLYLSPVRRARARCAAWLAVGLKAAVGLGRHLANAGIAPAATGPRSVAATWSRFHPPACRRIWPGLLGRQSHSRWISLRNRPAGQPANTLQLRRRRADRWRRSTSSRNRAAAQFAYVVDRLLPHRQPNTAPTTLCPPASRGAEDATRCRAHHRGQPRRLAT